MSTNTRWNAFMINTTTQSVQYDLTPTLFKQMSNQDPSSLLSLSNYLQYEDQSISYHDKYPENNQRNIKQQQKIIKRSHLFTQNYSLNQKSNLLDSYSPQDQQSQSMLLLNSEIKQSKRGNQQSYSIMIDSKKLLTQVISSANADQNETKQSFLSTIQERNSLNNNLLCTESIQLMELLSIPKDSQTYKLRQSIKSICNNDNQLQKMKKIIQLFTSNCNNQDKPLFSCTKCNSFEKRIKTLQQYLDLKEKQISKYEELIDQFNSKMFDLKIQNKRLNFQNQKYLQQIEELLSEKTKIQSKQRLNTVSNESSEDCSFFDDQNFGVINSRVLSRALSKKNFVKQETSPILKNDSQSVRQNTYRSPCKQYPQTPIPTTTYLKPKKQRKPSNFSDHSLQISISKVKEPSLYRIAEMKIEKISQQKKKQYNPKNQNGIKRFSDLLSQLKNENFDETSDGKNKSPIKKHDFYKVKTKQSLPSNNLKNHPLNKISNYEDNYSQSSETKTQKLYYGTKKPFTSEVLLAQNDYNILNKKNIIKGFQNNQKKVQTKQNNKFVEKNSLVYKSFKQIGTVNNENSQNKQIIIDEKRIKDRSPYKFSDQYGIQSNLKNVENVNIFPDKKERKCFSPSPNSLGIRRQNTQRSNPHNSPHTKQNLIQTQIKSFLR